jgi:hypothetical protein
MLSISEAPPRVECGFLLRLLPIQLGPLLIQLDGEAEVRQLKTEVSDFYCEREMPVLYELRLVSQRLQIEELTWPNQSYRHFFVKARSCRVAEQFALPTCLIGKHSVSLA